MPQSSSGRVEPLQDPQQGAATVHAELVGRHQGLFEVRWVPAEQVRAEAISAWKAIEIFFNFLLGSLRAAPGAALERLKGRGATMVSARVQAALFGSGDSRYEVVTRGVNAAGLPPGTRELQGAADVVRDRLAGVVPAEGTTPDLGSFWSDAVAGALSLADAGDHGSQVGPVLVGGTPRVVRESSSIAPAPADAYRVSPAVAAKLGATTVTPYDSRLQQQAGDVMAQLATPGEPVLDSFARWRQRSAASYTGLLGVRLAAEVEQRAGALARLLGQLRADRGQGESEDVGPGLRRVRTLVLRYLLVLLAIVVAAVVVARLGLLSTPALVALLIVLVVGWTVSQVLALVSQQRRVFAILNAQRRAEEELELASRNVPVAAAALHLSTTMYEQYLAWAPVLGRFLREPFGPLAPPAEPARLRGLLPRAVGFGIAETDDDRLGAVAHDLGGVVYDRGWLQPLWEAFLADAPRQLGPAGLSLREDPRQLLADPAAADDSLLRRWSAAVAAQGVPSGAGDALWERARAALVARGADALSGQLLTSVQVQAQEQHGISGLLTGREFFTVVTDALQDVAGHYFSPQLFTDVASAQDRHRVTSTVALGRREVASLGSSTSAAVTWIEPADSSVTSLDQFLVVLQATSPVPGDQLTLRGRGSRRVQPDPGPQPADDGGLV